MAHNVRAVSSTGGTATRQTAAVAKGREPNGKATPKGEARKPKGRVAWIDIAKGIAIILVVTGHTVSSGSQLIPMIFMFHMPLFFIMSGYTFKPKPAGEVIRSSAQRLLVPYVIIFVLWQGVKWLRQPDALSLGALGDLALRFIFASGSPNDDMGITTTGMAWFLMCLFVSRVMLNGLVGLFDHHGIGLVAQAVVFAVMAAAGIFIGDELHVFLPFDLDLALVTAGFMWCGYTARKTSFMARWGTRWYVLVAAAILYIAAFSFSYLELAMRLYGIAPLCIAGALGGSLVTCWLSMLIERFSRLLTRFLTFMGRNSMYIYCFHCLDWWVPWKDLAALQGVPFSHAIASASRTLYAVLMTLLVKRI